MISVMGDPILLSALVNNPVKPRGLRRGRARIRLHRPISCNRPHRLPIGGRERGAVLHQVGPAGNGLETETERVVSKGRRQCRFCPTRGHF